MNEAADLRFVKRVGARPRHSLVRAGVSRTVVFGCFRSRPDGGLAQRSLYIGCDPAVVTKTRELIADWQVGHRELLRTADLAALVQGASTRRRRALKKRMNQLAGNPLGLWPLFTDSASRADYMGRGQGGRPHRTGLW